LDNNLVYQRRFDTSWLTQAFIKPQKPVVKDMKMQDLEEEKKVQKL